jgi:hypothetical protein
VGKPEIKFIGNEIDHGDESFGRPASLALVLAAWIKWMS